MARTAPKPPAEIARPDGPTPRIGISRCLLGDNVRVNGGHCQDKWVLGVLGKAVEFVGVCPEVEVGLPTPRPTMRLAITEASGDADDIRLVESKTGDELTEPMAAYVTQRAEELAGMALDGFILKKDSPTCGVFRVKVYDRNGSPSRRGRGLFAEALQRRLPNLPVEEEGRLHDPGLREAFLVRIHAHTEWQRYLKEDGSAGGLVDFHARHKMLLLAADPTAYRRLGRLVAGHEEGLRSGPERAAAYERRLMRALARPVSPGRHVNVLQHLLGFCKTGMATAEKRELSRVLGLYLKGAIPRAAPVALVRLLLIRHAAPDWATQQVYLEPYAPDLAGEQRA